MEHLQAPLNKARSKGWEGWVGKEEQKEKRKIMYNFLFFFKSRTGTHSSKV
jgi:hypothetical protein